MHATDLRALMSPVRLLLKRLVFLSRRRAFCWRHHYFVHNLDEKPALAIQIVHKMMVAPCKKRDAG